MKAREASDSIKPGAQAPGCELKIRLSPRSGRQRLGSRAVARFAGSTMFGVGDPGAGAPGYMLSPASRAQRYWSSLNKKLRRNSQGFNRSAIASAFESRSLKAQC